MKLRPLTEGAPGKSVWPAIDPYPAVHGLVLDFIGSKTCGRPFYKLVNDRYADATQIPGWSYSGSTSNGMPRYAETRAGKLVPFANGVPRITDRGLLIEEARTNYVWNNVMAGVVAGSPGAAPTYWVTSGSSPASVGLTQTVSSGVEDGLTFFEITLSGTPTGTGGTGYYFTGQTENVLVSPGQTWTASTYARVVGAPTGVTSFTLSIVERAAGGASTGSSSTAMTLGSSMARFVHTRTMSGAATVRAQANVGVNFTIGVPLNVTYRIYAPQMEQGAFVTSPILTATGVAARGADSAAITSLAAMLGRFRTNLVPYSTPTAGQWTTTAVGVGSAPVVTYGAAVGPNGTAAARVQFALNGGSTGGDQSNFYAAAAPYISGVTATASVWLRSNTASTYAVAIATPNGQQVVVNVTPAWQRFSITHTPAASGSGGVAVRLRGATGSSDSADILVADAQWEAGGTATELIVSAGAATSVGNPFTIAASADLPPIDGVARTLATVDDSSVNNRVRLSRNASNQGQSAATVAGMGQASLFANGFAGAILLKMATRVKPASYSGVVNGAASAAGITAPTGLNRIRFGFDADGASSALNGYLQRVVILGDVDDASLQALAA